MKQLGLEWTAQSQHRPTESYSHTQGNPTNFNNTMTTEEERREGEVNSYSEQQLVLNHVKKCLSGVQF